MPSIEGAAEYAYRNDLPWPEWMGPIWDHLPDTDPLEDYDRAWSES